MALLSEPTIELDRGLRRAYALVVVPGERAMAAGQRAVKPRLLQLITDAARQLQAVSAILLGAPVIEAREHHCQVRIGTAGDCGEIARQGGLQALLDHRGA